MTRDIVIVGAGTAGMTAGLYAARAGLNALILERKSYGGQIINTPEIVNYPGFAKISGFEFAENLRSQIEAFGVEIRMENATGIAERAGGKTVLTEGGSIDCRAVILATGALNRPLGIDDEQKYIGRGISYCATCDGMFFRGREVAVVGGGNTAVEDALFLSNYCSQVTLIHRRQGFRAEPAMLETLRKKENVRFVLDSVVTALDGEDRLTSVIVENTATGQRDLLVLDGLFVAIGQTPDNGAFSPPVALDEYGYILAGEDTRTNVPGIFAAGDGRTKQLRQLVTAASDGATAALAAAAYLDQ